MKEADTQAVVVRRGPYREADLVVTLVTRDFGKLAALARSGRKSRRRFGAALESYRLLRARLRLGRGMAHLVEATVLEDYGTLGQSLGRLALAGYFCELVRETLPEEQPEPAVFELLVSGLRLLSEIPPTRTFVRVFELRLLDLLGMAPETKRCVAPGCGRRADHPDGDWAFSVALGGVVCPDCRRRIGRVLPMAGDGIALLQKLSRRSLGEAAHMEEIPRALNDDIQRALEALLLDHIGHPLKSVAFIRQLQAARKETGARTSEKGDSGP